VSLCLSAVAGAAPATGQSAPGLVLPTLAGVSFDLAAQRGKVVIVNVWATWCPPCVAEMPILDAFYRAHREGGVVLLGLSADRKADRREVERVMSRYSYPAALLLDATVSGWGAPQAVPITYVVDAAGTVRAVFIPGKTPVSEASLEAAVRPLLGEAGDAPATAAGDARPVP
jgi:thiol-disulfide isomerase/thioredoxin